jgi:hypothetical protein
MDNFQYTVQLSDQDWAEFSATADECGLLQAGLASGDELLSSDIDQGDSSDSSPSGPPPLLTGQLALGRRDWWGCEEGGEVVATQQLISRSQCEPILALEASQQAVGTSALSEGLLSLSSGTIPLVQCSSLPGPAASRGEMQRLLQGPAPSPPGEPPQSPESPGCSLTPQKSLDNPGVPPWSPGCKKRSAVCAKWGGHLGAPGPVATQLGYHEARPEGIVVGTAKLTAEVQQDKPEPDSADAPKPSSGSPELVARRGPGLDLSTSIPTTEQGTDQIRMTPRAELHTISIPVQEVHPDSSMAKSDMAPSTPACKPQPHMALSTPASKPDMTLSTSAFKPQPHMALSTPASKPDMTLSIPASKPQPHMALSISVSKPDMTLSTPASKPQPDMSLSTPASSTQIDKSGSASASTSRLYVGISGTGLKPGVDLSPPISMVVPHAALLHSASKTASDMDDTPAALSLLPVPWAEATLVDTKGAVTPEGHREKPRREPSAGAPGDPSGEPLQGSVQVPKRKKVRFSMTMPSPEELGSGEAAGSPSSTTPWIPASRTAIGGRGGSAAWDAVAVGPRSPQPRILKHLPPPSPSASVGPEPGSRFAVTLPEAYEFFFCDTIEEEEEDVAGEAAASQALGEVQWPDMCEFFFQDCRAQRSRCQGHHSPMPSPRAEPAAATLPGDPVPISIPEAYEHFFEEDGLGDALPPATLLQLQTTEPLREVGLGAPPKPGPVTTQQLSLAVRRAGRCCSSPMACPGHGNTLSRELGQVDMVVVGEAVQNPAVGTCWEGRANSSLPRTQCRWDIPGQVPWPFMGLVLY